MCARVYTRERAPPRLDMHVYSLHPHFLVSPRFGVIHSVFTNLLLWANGVLSESKHLLNEHKERLLTLGFGNVTVGECPVLQS